MKNNLLKLFLATAVGLVVIFAATVLYSLVAPQSKGGFVCAQVISPACFLGSPVCFDFSTPCSVPPLWTPDR